MLCWFSKYLFYFIFDESVAQELTPTIILCIAYYLNSLQNSVYRIALVYNKTKIILKKDIFIINFTSSIFYINKNFGIIGGSISVNLFYDR